MESGNMSSNNGGPSRCVDGCGFYANPGKENRCSECFLKFQNKQQLASRPIKAAPVSEAVIQKEEAATIRNEDEAACFKKLQNKQQATLPTTKAAPVSEAVIRKKEAATIPKEDEAACFKRLQNNQQATLPTIKASTSTAGLCDGASSVDHCREEEAAIRKDEETLIRKEGEAVSRKEEEEHPRKRNRCETCNRKVGLLGFDCRCGKVLCGSHRHPDEHSCTFDFKDLDRQVMVKNNPLVRADKLDFRV